MYEACFNVSSGDVEDAPALNALNKFDVFEKNGAVYIRANEDDIKSGQRNPVLKCSASKAEEKVVVIGGFVPHPSIHHSLSLKEDLN